MLTLSRRHPTLLDPAPCKHASRLCLYAHLIPTVMVVAALACRRMPWMVGGPRL